MYDAYLDPYCYRDSAVLRNKAGIRDQAVLDEFETAMTFARASEPLPAGRLSVSHYKAVHHHFFQEIYSWAGKFRTIRVTKGNSTFCYPENIPQEMARLFKWLGERRFLIDLDRGDFAEKAAHFLAKLNAIHPFREGNGRTQNAFLALLAGHPVDVTKLTPKATIDAMFRSFHGDEEPLAALIELLTQ